jgi:hypothetical protein
MRRPVSSFPAIAREAFGDNGCIVSIFCYFSKVCKIKKLTVIAFFFVSPCVPTQQQIVPLFGAVLRIVFLLEYLLCITWRSFTRLISPHLAVEAHDNRRGDIDIALSIASYTQIVIVSINGWNVCYSFGCFICGDFGSMHVLYSWR